MKPSEVSSRTVVEAVQHNPVFDGHVESSTEADSEAG